MEERHVSLHRFSNETIEYGRIREVGASIKEAVAQTRSASYVCLFFKYIQYV